MARFAVSVAAFLFVLGLLASPGPGQQPPAPTPPASTATPADYILLTVILKEDQSQSLDEIRKQLAETGFWAKFPPDGITVESWYYAMSLGHVVTLRVPRRGAPRFRRLRHHPAECHNGSTDENTPRRTRAACAPTVRPSRTRKTYFRRRL
jgi:hypothetical protein